MKKASSYEANANKIKRLEEEKSSLKRKFDRAKRMEKYENVDELLQEENRILKVTRLTIQNEGDDGMPRFPHFFGAITAFTIDPISGVSDMSEL